MDSSLQFAPPPGAGAVLDNGNKRIYGGVGITAAAGAFMTESMTLTAPVYQFSFELEPSAGDTVGFGWQDFTWANLPHNTTPGSGSGHFLALTGAGNLYLGSSTTPVATGLGTLGAGQIVYFVVDVRNALAWVQIQNGPVNGNPLAVPAAEANPDGSFGTPVGGLDISSLISQPLFPFGCVYAVNDTIDFEQAGQWLAPVTVTYATAPFTPGDLIRLAMLQAGSSCGGCGPGLTIGSTIYAEEMYVALNLLNGLVAQWQRRRWLVWDLAETVLVSTGAQSYSIGAGQAFNVARPDRIDSAFVRWLTTSLPLDAPLGIVAARENYNQITLKTMGTVPRALFYDSAWPVGQLYFWPVPPAASYELHVFTKTTVPVFGDLTTAIALPPEYQQALMFGLAVLLRPVMGLAADPSLNAQAAAAIATIRIANTQIPTLGMPPGLPGRSAGGSVSADVDINFQTGSW